MVSPAGNQLGAWAILIPVAGSLVIGLMARLRLRAQSAGMEFPRRSKSILITAAACSRAWRYSAAVVGNIDRNRRPFGAEGPIIMTGGALDRWWRSSSTSPAVERKTLLVAGAAAGMSGDFCLADRSGDAAVELLLFEWKPRSLVPVALASATAGAARRYILGWVLCFRFRIIRFSSAPEGLLGCVLVRAAGRRLSALPTGAVYAAGRLVCEAADPLDVVAGHRRSGSGSGGPDFSASVGGRLRDHSERSCRVTWRKLRSLGFSWLNRLSGRGAGLRPHRVEVAGPVTE